MKSTVSAFVGACSFGVTTATTEKSNPLGQVIDLLASLSAKVIKEGEAEAKAYKEYFEWCDDGAKTKGFELATARSTKTSLQASIEKEAAISSEATSKIEDLTGSIAADEAELKSAGEVRVKELADFKSEETELVGVVGTLDRAIAIVEREMAKNPAALAQVDTSSFDRLIKSLSTIVDAAGLSSGDKQSLVALVQSQHSGEADDFDSGAPAAAAYKSHSSGIIDVLDDLKEKAEDQLATLRKTETGNQHNYNMLRQSLEDQVSADTKDLLATKAAKSAADEKRAVAQGDLAETEKEISDGEGALKNVHASCMQTAADHEATVRSRAQELKVIAQAKSILEESTGGAVGQTYSMIQVLTSSRFHTRADLANNEVVLIIKRLAKAQKSAALAQLASRIADVIKYGSAAGEDPFAKVKGLISQLITKLEEDSNTDASEKEYCDEQMSKTGSKKMELEYDLDKLTAKINSASAASTNLKQDVRELDAELAEISKSQADMDRVRAESHSDYTVAKSDLEAGLEGVRKALGVLRDYYGTGAASLVQQPAVPETHDKASGAAGSILGILEVIESDFAKNLAAEETQEGDAAAEYERLTQSNSVSRTLKEQDVKYKTAEYKALDKQLAELGSDRDSKDAELSAVVEYFGKIKERCIAKAETYEDRKARRQAEIDGLKQALNVLETEAALVQRKHRGHANRFLGADSQ